METVEVAIPFARLATQMLRSRGYTPGAFVVRYDRDCIVMPAACLTYPIPRGMTFYLHVTATGRELRRNTTPESRKHLVEARIKAALSHIEEGKAAHA